MDHRQAEYFLAICEAGSITQAAEDLFMTRQALSSSMRMLESELGVPLFVRSKLGVTLTREGLLFKRYAEGSVRLHKELLSGIGRGGGRHTLRFGAPLLYMEDEWVGKILSFSHHEPSILLEVENDEDYTAFFDKVLKGKLDIAWTRVPIEHERLECVKVRDLKLKVLVSKRSSLASLEQVDYTKDLFGRTHLCVSRDVICELKECATQAGVTCRYVSAQGSLLKSMVAEDEGFLVVPDGYESKLVSARTTTVGLVNFPAKRGIYLVFKKNPPDHVTKFVDYFMEHVASPDEVDD